MHFYIIHGDITRLIPLGLLQRHPRRSPGVDTIATLLHRMPPPVLCSVLTADPASTALRDLHWLPVKHRITFKVATLMHQALHHRCPVYLADLVTFSSTDSHRQLHSTTTRAATIQRTRTQFWKTGFLCLGSRHVEQSSSICPQRRLQLVLLPPCSPAYV